MKTNLIEKIAVRYIVTGETVRELAKHFNLSKTQVHRYLCYKSKKYLPCYICELIEKRASSNILELKTYGKTVGNYNFNKDIRLEDLDTYDNEGSQEQKPFFTEKDLDEVDLYKIQVKSLLDKWHVKINDNKLKYRLRDSEVEKALEYNLSPIEFANKIKSRFSKNANRQK